MIEALSGAVTVGFIVAAALFLHPGRTSGDHLFLALGGALALLAVNQLLALCGRLPHRHCRARRAILEALVLIRNFEKRTMAT